MCWLVFHAILENSARSSGFPGCCLVYRWQASSSSNSPHLAPRSPPERTIALSDLAPTALAGKMVSFAGGGHGRRMGERRMGANPALRRKLDCAARAPCCSSPGSMFLERSSGLLQGMSFVGRRHAGQQGCRPKRNATPYHSRLARTRSITLGSRPSTAHGCGC